MKWKFTREELIEAGVKESIIQLVLSNAGNNPLVATDVYNDVLYGDWNRTWELNDDYSVFPCDKCKSLMSSIWREWEGEQS